MIDLDAAFDEFVERFSNKRLSVSDRAQARLLWDTLVNGDDAAACHEAVLSGLTEYALAHWTPAYALGRIFGAKLPSVRAAEVPAAAMVSSPAPAPAPRVPSESAIAFAEVWGMWPHDRVRRREAEAVARQGWDRAVARFGVARVKDACFGVARDEARLLHRRKLLTVLEDLISGEEDVTAAIEHWRKEPTVEDLAAFRTAYTKYPRPALDEAEALDLYMAEIQPEERLSFLAAVVAYRKTKAETEAEAKYLTKWAAFVHKEWREWQADGSEELWNAIYAAAGIERADLYYYREEQVTSTRVNEDGEEREGTWTEMVCVTFQPMGDLRQDVEALIKFVSANRARGTMDGDVTISDPLAMTAAEIIAGAREWLDVGAPAPARNFDI